MEANIFDSIALKSNEALIGIMNSMTGFYVPGWCNTKPKVQGTVAPGFEPVRDAFQRLYDEGQDSKSQLCFYVGDKCVVDLWGDAEGKSYGPDRISTIHSSGKSVASILMGIMQSQGKFEWDDPVMKYWPEFAKNGKEWIKIRDVLSHDLCLYTFEGNIDLKDATASQIKKNTIGKLIEDQSCFYHTKAKRDNPG